MRGQDQLDAERAQSVDRLSGEPRFLELPETPSTYPAWRNVAGDVAITVARWRPVRPSGPP